MLRVIWDGLSCSQLECEELFNTHLDVNLETALLALLVFWEGQLRQCIKKKKSFIPLVKSGDKGLVQLIPEGGCCLMLGELCIPT